MVGDWVIKFVIFFVEVIILLGKMMFLKFLLLEVLIKVIEMSEVVIEFCCVEKKFFLEIV